MQGLDSEDALAICNGALRQAESPKQKQQSDMDAIGGQSLTASPGKDTFYNSIYVRRYEPEFVKQEINTGEHSHLAHELFKGNPELLFKSLLR